MAQSSKKRGRLAEEVLSLAETLKVKDKLGALRDEDLREVDLETAVALGIDREKSAKITCRIRCLPCPQRGWAMYGPGGVPAMLASACRALRRLGVRVRQPTGVHANRSTDSLHVPTGASPRPARRAVLKLCAPRAESRWRQVASPGGRCYQVLEPRALGRSAQGVQGTLPVPPIVVFVRAVLTQRATGGAWTVLDRKRVAGGRS
jgi:hypothetical protein